MISLERKEFNKAVRELDELHWDFYSKLEASIVAVLKTQPDKKIVFTEHRPLIVQDIANGGITKATISSIRLGVNGDNIIAEISWKGNHVSFDNEPVSLWYHNLCDLYHSYTTLTEAIKKTLKDNESNNQ